MTEKRSAHTLEDSSLSKPRWEEPRLRGVGTVGEVLQDTGKGKLSITGGDPGESRKPSGGE
jgi:hypothetical protein